MVQRRVRRRPCAAVVVASAAVAAGAATAAAVGGGPGPRYAGTDPDTETYTTSWDSSPFNIESVTDNNLGLMAKSCSKQFCHAGIDGLDLWLSFEEVRALSSQPEFAAMLGGEDGKPASASAVGGPLSTGEWHPVSAWVICGLVGAASVVAGFELGAGFNSYHKGNLH